MQTSLLQAYWQQLQQPVASARATQQQQQQTFLYKMTGSQYVVWNCVHTYSVIMWQLPPQTMRPSVTSICLSKLADLQKFKSFVSRAIVFPKKITYSQVQVDLQSTKPLSETAIALQRFSCYKALKNKDKEIKNWYTFSFSALLAPQTTSVAVPSNRNRGVVREYRSAAPGPSPQPEQELW